MSDLTNRVMYQLEVVELLKVKAECRRAPWLSKDELNELVEWYDADESAADFATMLLHRDTRGMEAMLAPTINPGPRLVR